MSATDQPKSVVTVADGPDTIWLEPSCCADPSHGRQWCEDDAFPVCDDGRDAVKYVRADRAALAAAPLPQAAGSDAAKLIAYEDAHAVAVELGYPSLTEALEALAVSPHHIGDVTNMICTGAGWTVAQTVSQLEQEAARDGLPVSTVHRLKVAATTIAALSAPISGEGELGIVVVREPASGMEREHCCFCAKKTEFWSAKADVAVCPTCAGTRYQYEVPTKAEWIRSPQSKGIAAPTTYGKGEREAIHAWLREDTSLVVKMNITPESVAKLVERIQALQLGRE